LIEDALVELGGMGEVARLLIGVRQRKVAIGLRQLGVMLAEDCRARRAECASFDHP
jgi:hypothetical protein